VAMGNNPVNGIDPDGTFVESIIIGAAIGAFMGYIEADMNKKSGLEGALKGLLVGAVGGGLSTIGGGSFLANVAWGAAEGGITGGLNSMLNGGNVINGALRGAAWGAGFATLNSGIVASRNYIDGYGFRTNDGVIDNLLSKGLRQEAIDFVKNRYGMALRLDGSQSLFKYTDKEYVVDGKEFSKDELKDYIMKTDQYLVGATVDDYRSSLVTGYTKLNEKTSYITPLGLESRNALKSTMAHEYGHQVKATYYKFAKVWNEAPTSKGNYNFNEINNMENTIWGFGTEAANVGRLHISLNYMRNTNPLWGQWKEFSGQSNLKKLLWSIPLRNNKVHIPNF
jgi:hypothetical protein